MEIVILKKISFKDHVKVAEIEKKYFKEELVAALRTTQNWYLKNDGTLIIAKDKNNGAIVGHISFIPVDDYMYGELKEGVFIDA